MKTKQLHLPRVVVAIVLALLVTSCTREAKKARYLARADRYFQTGEYDKAKIEYTNALRLNPKQAVAFQQIGVIWFEQGDPLLALQFLLKARELAPNNVAVRAKLSSTFLSLGDVPAARKEALAILALAPANEEAILLLSEAIRNQDEMEATGQQLQKFPNHDTGALQLATARLLLRKGDQAGGEAALQRALTLDPKSPDTHLALASLFLYQKNVSKATGEFKAAAELSPPRGGARLKYAAFKLQSGATDEAKAILKEMSARTPDYLPAWQLQAQIAFSEKKLDEALALIANILGRDGANLDARLLQAQLWLAKGDGKKAVEDLERLQQTYPTLPGVKYRLALAYLQNGNTSQALVVLNQAVAANPNYTDAVLLLAEVNMRTGNAKLIVAPISKLLSAQPGLLRARLLLADAYRVLGKFDDAAALFRDQIKDNPKDPQPYFMLGMTLREQGHLPEARAAFEKTQELAPQNILATYQLVELDILDKDFDAALKRVAVQIQAQPKSGSAQFLQGKIYAAQKDWPRAEAALLKAVDLDPNLMLAYDLLTSAYIAQNKIEPAIEETKALLVKHPTNVSALILLGNLYESTRQFPQAREAYERLLAVNPDFAAALNNLACDYAEHGNDLDKALGLAKRARALLPDDPQVADTLGWILYRKGDYQQALNLLQESAAKTPVAPEILYHLGMAHYMMADLEAARTALQEAARSPDDFTGKAEIPSRLALLGGDAGQPATPSADELEAILQQRPDDLLARMALGEAREKQKEWTKAAAAYELVLAANANLLPATLKLAELNAGPLNHLDKAFELAKKAREMAPSDPRAAGILGGIVYRTGKFPLAFGLLQEAIRPITDDAKASATLHAFAWAAYAEGNVPEARQAMQRVLSAAPDSREAEDARTFLAMTDLEENPKDTAETGTQIAKLLEAAPDYVPALMAQAGLQMKRGESKAAVDGYTAVLRHFPDFAPAQKHLAALDMEDPATLAAAYDLAAKAHKSLPEDAELSQTLAEISYRRKEYPYAVQLFQESAKKRPLDARSLYSLGMSLRETGEKVKSRETLQQSLLAGLPAPLSAEATRVVAELDKK